jgi:hypothetical protein
LADSPDLRRPSPAEFLLFLPIPVLVGILAVSFPYFVDDAFISFRITENILHSGSPHFTQGNAVYTSTSLFYPYWNTIWLVIAGQQWIDWIPLINGLLLAASAIVCVKKVFDTKPEANLFPKFITVLFILPWITEFKTITYGNSGLETSLYMLLLAIFILPSDKIQSRKNQVLSWFLVFIRPEGWLTGMAQVSGYRSSTIRKEGWFWLITGLISLLLWAGVGYYFFGTAIPQSILAKSNHSIDRWVEIQKGYAYLLFADHPLSLLITVSGYYFFPEIRPYFRLPVTWMALYLSFFSFLAAWWPWYLPPLFIPFWYMTMLSTMALANGIPDFPAFRNFSKPWLQFAILIAVVGHGTKVSIENFHLIRGSSEAFLVRQAASQKIAGFIKTNTDPKKTLLLEPMGLIGYYSEKTKILDYPGLASPQVCTYLKRLQKRIPHRLTDPVTNDSVLQKFHPDYLLIWREERKAFSSSVFFQSHYRLMESFSYFKAEPRMDSVFLFQAVRN